MCYPHIGLEHLKLLLEQLDKYKAGIIALQEICWTGEGILEKKKDWTIFYSGHKRQYILGTGFAVKKHVKHLIIGYQGLTPHISTLTLKGKFLNYTLINAHSLTDVS